MVPCFIQYNYAIVQPVLVAVIPLHRVRVQSVLIKPFENTKPCDNTKPYDNTKPFDNTKPYDNTKSFDNTKLDNTKPLDNAKSFDNSANQERKFNALQQKQDALQAKVDALTNTVDQLQSKQKQLTQVSCSNEFMNNKLSVNQVPVVHVENQQKQEKMAKAISFSPYLDTRIIKNSQFENRNEKKDQQDQYVYQQTLRQMIETESDKMSPVNRQISQDETKTIQKKEPKIQTNNQPNFQRDYYRSGSSLIDGNPKNNEHTKCDFFKNYQKSKSQFLNKSFKDRLRCDIQNRESKLSNYGVFLKQQEKVFRKDDQNTMYEIQEALEQVQAQIDLDLKRKDHITQSRINRTNSSLKNSINLSYQQPTPRQSQPSIKSKLQKNSNSQVRVLEQSNNSLLLINQQDSNFVRNVDINIEKNSTQNSSQERSIYPKALEVGQQRKPDAIRMVRNKIKQILQHEPHSIIEQSQSQDKIPYVVHRPKDFSSYRSILTGNLHQDMPK